MIILTYGQPKSASTFLFLLMKRACEVMGSDLCQVRRRVFSEDPSRTEEFWRGHLDPLAGFVGKVHDSDFLPIKTHDGFPKKLERFFKSGEILPYISYRNIGDSALSAFEAGEKARREKNYKQDFHKIESHREAIDYIGKHVVSFTIPWLRSRVGYAYSYDDISSSPAKVLESLSEVANVDPELFLRDPVLADLIEGKRKAYNFNKGVSGRHMEMFSEEDLAYLEEKYGRFNKFCAQELSLDQL
ncbi:hypothetical protein [Roseovarius sp.]|uniref:hypothetical protein n=1 Tax=Roseovarius sp. TaxID=1486281 RepID=UPI00262C60FE|nr:hypothetical protein [Roseovarius sp.]